MAFLYKRDLDILGYDIKVKEIKRKRLLSIVAHSELIAEKQIIPCVATFFRYTKGFRVDYINDKETEDRIMDWYMILLREHPKLLFERITKLLVKGATCISEIVMIMYLLYVLTFKVSILSIDITNQIYSAIKCLVLVGVVTYLMDII